MEKKNYSFYDRCPENYDGQAKYLVESYGGEWEDSWSSPLQIFDTEEDAAHFVNDNIKSFNKKKKTVISRDDIDNIRDNTESWLFKKTFGDIDYNDVSQDELDKFYCELEGEKEYDYMYEYCQSAGLSYSKELIEMSFNFYDYDDDYFYKVSGYTVYKLPYNNIK